MHMLATRRTAANGVSGFRALPKAVGLLGRVLKGKTTPRIIPRKRTTSRLYLNVSEKSAPMSFWHAEGTGQSRSPELAGSAPGDVPPSNEPTLGARIQVTCYPKTRMTRSKSSGRLTGSNRFSVRELRLRLGGCGNMGACAACTSFQRRILSCPGVQARR